MQNLIKLFIAFLKPGIFGFGGGQAAIPLIQKEVVDNYGFITLDEFANSYAFGNMLPGPIATKMAAAIGYSVSGILGAIVATLAMILPSAIAVVGLAGLYLKFEDRVWMQNIMKGAKPVIVALLLKVTYDMAKKSLLIQGNIDYRAIIIFVVAVGIIFFTKLHPAILIIVSMIAGVLIYR